jgi:hypothetical protein
MKDALNSSQSGDDFRAEEAVSVADNADSHAYL